MFNPAADFFDAMNHIAVEYSDSLGTFSTRAAFAESDRAFRTTGRDDLIGSSSSAVVIADPRYKRGGKLTAGATIYRINTVIPSNIPGLSDLALQRLEGAAALVFDATDQVPLEDTLEYQGTVYPCHANRTAEVEELGKDGTRKVVARVLIAVRVSDLPNIKGGDKITFDGRLRPIARVMADGVGFLKLLV
ncbi:head-tail joining protein [Tabrizicola soli]|uniref:Head decoration protein n=1 Tax=Tabrizicola soli TaxID=2185115 RepID=A0ABV7E1F1_9RHOB|nr:hypothetical protein [Tabrizicola soli]